LCRSIIESHRGRIRAQNLYNGDLVTGCRFTFTLPTGEAQNGSFISATAVTLTPALSTLNSPTERAATS